MITILRGQCDEGTKNELELSPGYDDAICDGDVVTIMKNLKAICLGNDDGGMSYKPYKATLAVKSLNNFTNPKVTDPHYFKDELRTKFQATLSVTGRFLNGTAFMEECLRLNKAADGKDNPLTLDNYFCNAP